MQVNVKLYPYEPLVPVPRFFPVLIRVSTPNERVRCTTHLAIFSFNGSIGRAHRRPFPIFHIFKKLLRSNILGRIITIAVGQQSNYLSREDACNHSRHHASWCLHFGGYFLGSGQRLRTKAPCINEKGWCTK